MSANPKLRAAYAAMRAAYPGWARLQDSESIKVWGELLDDIDEDSLLDAIKSLAKSSKFAPTIAEIRSAAWAESPERKDPEALERARQHREWAAREDARVHAELAAGVEWPAIESAKKTIRECE